MLLLEKMFGTTEACFDVTFIYTTSDVFPWGVQPEGYRKGHGGSIIILALSFLIASGVQFKAGGAIPSSASFSPLNFAAAEPPAILAEGQNWTNETTISPSAGNLTTAGNNAIANGTSAISSDAPVNSTNQTTPQQVASENPTFPANASVLPANDSNLAGQNQTNSSEAPAQRFDVVGSSNSIATIESDKGNRLEISQDTLALLENNETVG